MIQVRGYVLLANALLHSLSEDVKKDEAGTRALWASEKHNYIEVHARHILVRYKGVKTNESASKGLSQTQDEAKQRAARLFQKVKQGGDFAAIAKADSDDESTSKLGGELPAFTRGAMTAEFGAVFALPVSGISEPFKTEFGYCIVRGLTINLPFEKVRAALENIRARNASRNSARQTFSLTTSISSAKKTLIARLRVEIRLSWPLPPPAKGVSYSVKCQKQQVTSRCRHFVMQLYSLLMLRTVFSQFRSRRNTNV